MAKEKDKQIILEEKDIKQLNETFEGKSFSEVMNSDDEGGTLEKSVFMLTNKLFSKENLYMIARLDENLAFYMIKHVILKRVFYDYYMHCTLKFKTIEVKEDEKIIKYLDGKRIEVIVNNRVKPYYQVNAIVVYPEITLLEGAYDNFINDIMELTISFKGLGREEIRDLIRGLHGEIEKKEGGLMNRLFNK